METPERFHVEWILWKINTRIISYFIILYYDNNIFNVSIVQVGFSRTTECAFYNTIHTILLYLFSVANHNIVPNQFEYLLFVLKLQIKTKIFYTMYK